jgi:hypothetical protein
MDTSNLSTFPVVADTDYSPSNETFSYADTFDKAYLADFYTTPPDHSLDTFLDCDSFFDRPVSSVEFPARFNGANTSLNTNTTTNLNAYQPPFNPAPFGQLEQGFASSFPFSMSESFVSNMPISPRTLTTDSTTSTHINTCNHSPTPSLCGEGLSNLPTSPPLSPSSLKRETPNEPTSAGEEPEQKRPQRKRGRPRLDRNLSDTPSISSNHSNHSASSAKHQCQQNRSSRLPHNQVERKYREGLNSELERLRRAVPTLPQSDEGQLMGQPKPSKAMVLAGAIEYIRKIERERDALLEENESLGGSGWKAKRSRREDSVSESLVDE